MGAVIGIALLALLVLIAALGLSPVAFVPVGILVLVVVLRPVLGSLYGSQRRRRRSVSTPATSEASYEPVSDPARR